MPGISQVDLAYSRLEFQCAHEVDVLPILNSSADILYRYGVYLEKLKGKKLQRDSTLLPNCCCS